MKLVAGRQVDTFDALLRPTRPLGDSAAIHGISEETLHSHGRDPADVFREFARFAEGAVLVGHNVSFDLSMIRAHAGRLGITLQTGLWDDTLDIARRFLNLERHDLTTVSRHSRSKEPRHSCRVANAMRKNRAKLPTFLPPGQECPPSAKQLADLVRGEMAAGE